MPEPIYEQPEFFPETVVEQKSTVDQLLKQKFPFLEYLGVPFDEFSGFNSPYVRVHIADESIIYESGGEYTSHFSDRNIDEEDNIIKWSQTDSHNNVLEGFVEALTTIQENGDIIIHLLHDVTDIDFSTAIRLDDITELAIYPDNAAQVMAMHQNADVDGGIFSINDGGIWVRDIAPEQLAEYVEDFWPEPEVVWKAENS